MKTKCRKIAKYDFIILFVFLSSILISPNMQAQVYSQIEINKTEKSFLLNNNQNQNYFDDTDIKIPNQFIIYLRDYNDLNSIDPFEFYQEELKNTGTELLFTYNYVVKGLAIKISKTKYLQQKIPCLPLAVVQKHLLQHFSLSR